MRRLLILTVFALTLSCSVQPSQEAIVTEISTDTPTQIATEMPTDLPTEIPTDTPTDNSTEIPTDTPTDIPTEIPTDTPAGIPCAPGAQCIQVDSNGNPADTGQFVAQCSGQFPDYVDQVSEAYEGPRFLLSQDYPTSLPTDEPSPWKEFDFRTEQGADDFMMAVRQYIYEGMEEADWKLEQNTARHWYHVPWMTLGQNPREFVRGLTPERRLRAPELGIRPGVTVQNWAVGFYNSVGAYTIGQIWNNPHAPDPSVSQFGEGTVVAKVLFTAAKPEDFAGPDPAAGAPSWDANIFESVGSSDKEIQSVRLLQMDVAIRDDRAGVTGWVFGTFAYDPNSQETDPWDRMMPVGLMWGNDPTLIDSAYQAGSRPTETIVSDLAPFYAVDHLGRSSRLNGPVDNPASACLSCHSTAQVPAAAPMYPRASCSESQVMYWFRNIAGNEAFGAVNGCEPQAANADNTPVAVDYSLQVAVAIANQLRPNLVNSCSPQVDPQMLILRDIIRTSELEVYEVER